jgi:hypothetical protein
MLRIFQLAPVVLSLLLAGASSCTKAANGPKYSIGFFNDTPGRVDHVRAD